MTVDYESFARAHPYVVIERDEKGKPIYPQRRFRTLAAASSCGWEIVDERTGEHVPRTVAIAAWKLGAK